MSRVSVDWLQPTELTGPHLHLTPLELSDDRDFLAALADRPSAERVTAHMPFAPPEDLQSARRIIAQLVEVPDRVVYVQRIASTGELIGMTAFYEIAPALRSIAIGHTWVVERLWRTGVNTESKLLMLSRAFDELLAERVVWHTDIRNQRSQAAIERLGATREGVLRHHRIRRDGSWRDTVQYSMLSEEWPAAKGRLQAALARGERRDELNSAAELDPIQPHPLQVVRNDPASRFEGRVGAELVGIIDYVREGTTTVITHTETELSWRGRGIAGQLTRAALELVRARCEKVVPLCPFTARYIEDHPEYGDLLG
jgi:RimJ/RimL family protein N-acetyltransferase/predicted GNAT family acetyltransferase